MPTTTPDIKVKAVRALGGTVELVGESYQEAQAHAQARPARRACLQLQLFACRACSASARRLAQPTSSGSSELAAAMGEVPAR